MVVDRSMVVTVVMVVVDRSMVVMVVVDRSMVGDSGGGSIGRWW